MDRLKVCRLIGPIMCGVLVSLGVWLVGLDGVSNAEAADRLSSGNGSLSSQFGSIRTRTYSQPRSTSYQLRRLEREAHRQSLEARTDPRIGHLKTQIRQERHRADRVIRIRNFETGMLRYQAPPRGSDPETAHFDNSLRDPIMPIGTGKRFLLIQRGLRIASDNFAAGRLEAGVQHLDQAANALDSLMLVDGDAISADDPNVVALQRQIEALRDIYGSAG